MIYSDRRKEGSVIVFYEQTARSRECKERERKGSGIQHVIRDGVVAQKGKEREKKGVAYNTSSEMVL